MHDNKTVLRGSGNEQGASDFFALITDIFSFVPTIFQPYHRLDLPHFPSHLLVQIVQVAWALFEILGLADK